MKRGLSAGAGGNISARDGAHIWIKPTGLALDELSSETLCRVDVDSGEQTEGRFGPTSELPMHLAIYRSREDVQAVFHTHSPFACGVISSDCEFRPMFPEVVADLGDVITLPYLLTSTQQLADAVAKASLDHDTILLQNHGVVCLGKSMREAFFRCCIVEDAAKSLVAASAVGSPRFLSDGQIAELKKLIKNDDYRKQMLERE